MFTFVRTLFPSAQKESVAAPPGRPRRSRPWAAAAAVVVALGAATLGGSPASAAAPTQSFIVVLKDGTGDAGAIAAAHRSSFGVTAATVYRNAVSGYAGTMTQAQAAQVAKDPRVDFVTADRRFGQPDEPKPAGSQVAPAWWQRIGGDPEEAQESARANPARDKGTGVNVAVIDSGIDGNHPDLNVRGGVDCTSGQPVTVTPIDKLGHGTAVAGVIGARNNKLGIIGTAPGTPLWSVRVVTDDDVITEASLICAIDWVTSTRRDDDPTNDISVANISIGGPGSDTANCGKGTDPMHYAICRSIRAGVTYAVAAGNESSNLAGTVPASYHEVLTATAIADFDGQPGGLAGTVCGTVDFGIFGQKDDAPAFFSNYAVAAKERRHTVAAPGVCVLSTAPGGYGINHGTSFASPAVAGAVALCISDGACHGSGAEVGEQFLDHIEAYNHRHRDFGFTGDPLRPVDAKYYGYLTEIARF